MAIANTGTALSGAATTVYESSEGTVLGFEFLATGADATLLVSVPGLEGIKNTSIVVDSADTAWYTVYSRKGFSKITATGAGATLKWRPVFCA